METMEVVALRDYLNPTAVFLDIRLAVPGLGVRAPRGRSLHASWPSGAGFQSLDKPDGTSPRTTQA
jgi:hypothetical protein